MATEAFVNDDDISSKMCTPCGTENTSIAASKFCNDCQEYLCLSCVKYHMKLGITRNHELVEITNIFLKRSLSKKTEERCLKHSGKVIGMFCSLHEEIGCHECMADNHVHCSDIIYIPERAKGIATSTELQIIKQDLESTKERLNILSYDRQNDLDRLCGQRDMIMNSFSEMKQSIINKLQNIDDLSKRTCQDIYKENVNSIQSDISACSALSNTLDMMSDLIKSTSDETLLFLQLMRAKRNVSAGLRLIDLMSPKVGRERLTLSPDPRIEHLLDDVKIFGQVNNVQRLYNAKFVEKFDVSIVSDKEKSDTMMFGCALLPDGRVVLSDFTNKRLKILNKEYKIMSYIELCGSPCGVCVIGEKEAAVCVFDKCLVQFVNLISTIRPTRSFKTELKCQGIAFDGTQLFVTVIDELRNQVRIYLLSGSLQRIIEKFNKQQLFSSISQIICCPYSARLYVTDTKKGVITLDKKGNRLALIEDKDIVQPTGITPDGDGGILVAGFETNKVAHFGQDGTKVSTLLTEKTGIKEPLSLCFHCQSSRLHVTLAGSKFIYIFQLYEKTTN